MFNNYIIGVLSGFVSGILSGILLYFHSTKVDKFRNILDYAERTSEYYYNIIQAASNLSEDNISNFKLLLNKNIRRGFWGKIKDGSEEADELQDSIAKCNEIIYKMGSMVELETLQNFIKYSNEVPDTSLDIWNAITNYSNVKYNVIGKIQKVVTIIAIIIAIITLISLIIA